MGRSHGAQREPLSDLSPVHLLQKTKTPRDVRDVAALSSCPIHSISVVSALKTKFQMLSSMASLLNLAEQKGSNSDMIKHKKKCIHPEKIYLSY